MTICEKCTKKASFNMVGLTAKYCLEHKTSNMIDVFNKKCKCGKAQPGYNMEGLKAICCVFCKTEGMIDLRHKKCKCGKTRPSFNYKDLKAEYCIQCKIDGMINVVYKRCMCGSSLRPIYNYKGLKPIYCSDCKKEDMYDIVNSKCFCKKSRPSFNFEGLNARYCSLCKLEGMTDVNHPTCFCGKSANAAFNYEGLKPLYCSLCRMDGMIDLIHKKCKCNKSQPTYNYEGLSSEYCVLCKLDGMIDVHHPKCKTLYCNIRVQEKYDGYCFRCFIHLFPDKPVSKNYKTKEFAVIHYVKNIFNSLNWVADKTIEDGCSKKRPDLLLDLGYQLIIVEVDENQHKKYDCSCENKRIMEISKDLGHRSIVFIRFNPDDYINDKNKKEISCWSVTKKTGIMKIENNKEWYKRLESLKETIEYWIENKTDKIIETIELFYDKNIV